MHEVVVVGWTGIINQTGAKGLWIVVVFLVVIAL